MRSAFFAALLGLLASVCAGQDQATQSQTTPGQATQGQAPQDQAPQNPTPQDQPSQSQAAPDGTSTSKAPPDQAAPDQAPQGQPAPGPAQKPAAPNKPAQKPIPQNQSMISLDSSETIFAVLTALNACGYDQDLSISDATRSNVRAEVQRNLRDSDEGEAARTALCEFTQNHVAAKDENRNLSQYISLALYMDGPPHFVPRGKEEDLPPDASLISAFGTLLERFYDKARLHSIWERHRSDYAAAMKRYHEPLAKMVFDTEIYLKQPSSQYLGRRFTIYLDFMGSPNETDARNYGSDYYVIVFPAPNNGIGTTGLTGTSQQNNLGSFSPLSRISDTLDSDESFARNTTARRCGSAAVASASSVTRSSRGMG